MVSFLVYSLPEDLRFDFARPRGIIARGDFTRLVPPSPSVACIGDVVSSFCAGADGKWDILVIAVDGVTRRRESVEPPRLEGFYIVRVRNPRGTISRAAARAVCNALSGRLGRKVALAVDGEEDMLALAAIACSPLGGHVIYGVPGRGAAIIRVTRLSRLDAQTRLLLLRPRIG